MSCVVFRVSKSIRNTVSNKLKTENGFSLNEVRGKRWIDY